MPRIAYKVNKTWLFLKLFPSAYQNPVSPALTQSAIFSSSLWVPLAYGGLQLCLSFCGCKARLIANKKGKALQSSWLQPLQMGHECMYAAPRGGDTGSGGMRDGGHIWQAPATGLASSPRSSCGSLHGYHWCLAVTAIISRRYMCSSMGIGVHTLCSTSSPRAWLPAELWVSTSPWRTLA